MASNKAKPYKKKQGVVPNPVISDDALKRLKKQIEELNKGSK